IFEQQEAEKLLPSHGEIQLTEEVVGFKKLKFFTLENVGSGELSLPEHEWHTTAFWLSIPREVLDEVPFDSEEKIDGVRGLSYALRGIAVISLMCDLRDLGVSVVDTLQDHKIYQRQLRRPETVDPSRLAFQPNIYLYDKYPGGIGFSKTLFDQRNNLLAAVDSLVRNCACQNGCPSCIGAQSPYSGRTREVVMYLLSKAY
ncbi:DUF1998 domain-containing protein, partial [bacterium]|nr:DUF1998 domain-containing protein [bacterium]